MPEAGQANGNPTFCGKDQDPGIEWSSAILNVGYGQESSVLNIFNTMKKVRGVNFPVRIAKRRPGDPMPEITNSPQIWQLTDWVPRIYNLDEICRSLLEWLRKNR